MTKPCDVAVELALGLTFKLRLRQLHADHRRQAFAHVVAGQVLFYVLEQTRCWPAALMVRVSAVRKPRQVGSAVDGVDVVGEAEKLSE